MAPRKAAPIGIGRDFGASMPRGLVAHQHDERREERKQWN